MDNSIRTTSKTTTPTLATNQAIFAIGDVVLCPSLSNQPFELTADPYGKRDELALAYDGGYLYYDAQGFFIKVSDDETGDRQPSLFHNTSANQQAINTLYGNTSITQSSQRTVIDTTDINDDEVVLLQSFKLSNNTSEVHGAAEVLDDISSLLRLIYKGEIRQEEAKSLARLTQTAADTWSEILYTQVEKMNEILALTNFNKVGE
ncbi:hypothetical protein [Psychrobacter sp. 230]|uniref:hypothetical protein n=1 Tax=Psychrobacter sp. 230 TaxID=2555884 RepID=UPI001068A2CD|nr:hypothetical protein [Psychrobacter sp. 230]TEW87504.1 hypothetical protein E2545_04535 [Psychrobacter sp. 230]